MCISFDELMQIGNNHYNFDKLVEQMKTPLNIIPFVGAGMSCPIYPLWETFLLSMAEEADRYTKISKKLKKGLFEEAAGDLIKDMKKRFFDDFMEMSFSDEKLQNASLDGAILLLPHLTHGPVITTNFDRVLEKVYSDAGMEFEEKAFGSHAGLINSVLSQDSHYLVKLHGDIKESTSWIITLEQYENNYGKNGAIDYSQPIPKILKRTLSGGRSLLFLGCSLKSDRIISILNDIAQEYGEIAHYAIVEKVDSEYQQRQRFFSSYGIRPIWYPEGKHECVKTLLVHLIHNKQKGNAGNTGVRELLFDKSKEYFARLNGSGGRFYHLNISDIILPGMKNNFIEIGVNVNNGTQIPLKQSIELLWEKEIKHAFIVGEGGMGKTVSLIRTWGEYINNKSRFIPIPIYIALNEYNNTPEDWKQNFIINTIGNDYLGKKNLSKDEENQIWDLLRKPFLERKDNEAPSIILLLDGFNEVTVDRTGLLVELKQLIENCGSVIQIILTSRVDMKNNLNFRYFNKLELTKLSDEQIEDYCRQYSDTHVPQGKLLDIVKIPMMLTIYMSTCQIVRDNIQNTTCEFKERVESSGELLWNFIESIVFKHRENLEKSYYYKFILKHLLPYIGWKMEQEGKFYLSYKELKDIINDGCSHFNSSDFFDAFPFFDYYAKRLSLGRLEVIEETTRFAEFKKAIVEELAMMVEENNTYRFLHQNFRDYFAAEHIVNEIEICLSSGDMLPEVLAKSPVSYYVGNYLGEIEGEHYNIPALDNENKCWSASYYRDTRLVKLLKKCRRIFDKSIGFTVWNIIEIWKNIRGELTGADLSYIDMSGAMLNMVRCSRAYGDKILAASFEGSILKERNILPQGHSEIVSSAVYSPDGKRILSTSMDKTVKEWDALTCECIRTYQGHSAPVISAVYSDDGKRILSASYDDTIKEWDVLTGECIRTYQNSSGVNSAVYSHDGKRILSASDDSTIKEWDALKCDCIRTYQGHSESVKSAVYSDDGKRILSVSDDKTIKEWDALTCDCIRTYQGHSESVKSAVYSDDGKKILSASDDKTIKEWNVLTGECIRTYQGHSESVISAVYSDDGKRILSASCDDTIKEWDALTGECIRTYRGHSQFVNSAVYSHDGKRILSASWDTTIKEWDELTGECIKTYQGHSSHVKSAVYRADGKRILSASYDDTIKEWNTLTGECIRTFQGHSESVESAVYSIDGKRILSASSDTTIKEWNVLTGECIRTYQGHSSGVHSAEYSDDGKRVLSAAGTIKEWDVLTGGCIRTYQDQSLFVNSAVYSIDGKRILSDPFDDTIKEWDAMTGECIRTYQGHSFGMGSAVYSADGKRILSASNKTIEEWDVTGECIRTYQGHSDVVNSAVYSIDGKRILSASSDTTIKEWDVSTGKCIRTYQGHSYSVESAVYSHDGKRIVSASWDKTIKEWDTLTGECINSIENIAGLMIYGCSFRNLHNDSDISGEVMKILKQYGAKEISIAPSDSPNKGKCDSRQKSSMSEKRFSVALSFPGQYRDYVKKVDAELMKLFALDKVFFDERYEAEIVGLDSDTVLQKIYHDYSDLVVVFLCKEYLEKDWCNNVECRAIRDRIKKGQGRWILPLRFDFTEIEGFFSIDICPDISKREPKDTAKLIYDRFRVIKGNIISG